MSPIRSCPRALFPLWDRCILSGVRVGVEYTILQSKIAVFPLTPTSELQLDLMDLPIPINIIPCYQKVQGNHYPHSWSFHQSPQGPEVSFDCPQASVISSPPAWKTKVDSNQRALLTGEFVSNVPHLSPWETADIPGSGVHSAYWTLCTP